MANETVTPVMREFVIRTAVSKTPSAELIPLLAHIMESYSDMTSAERAAIAAWFSMTYGAKA